MPWLSPDFGLVRCLLGARSARFFKKFDVLAHEIPKICSPAGALPSEVGPGSLSIGRILEIGWLSKYWKNIWHPTDLP